MSTTFINNYFTIFSKYLKIMLKHNNIKINDKAIYNYALITLLNYNGRIDPKIAARLVCINEINKPPPNYYDRYLELDPPSYEDSEYDNLNNIVNELENLVNKT